MTHPIFEKKFKKFREWLMKIRIPGRLIFIVMGTVSTLWFLIRVLPKPQRAGYPCMKAAFPIMSGFIIWLLTVSGSITAFKLAGKSLRARRFLVGGAMLLASAGMGVFALVQHQKKAEAAELYVSNDIFIPNEPMGEPHGIHPGRVVWIHNADATNENCPNNENSPYYSPDNNNQEVIDDMVDTAILRLTGEKNLSNAWNAIFKNFNVAKGKGDTGYHTGEKIFIKINQGTASWLSVPETLQRDYSSWKGGYDPVSETSPFTMLSILRHLIDTVGVPEEDIYLGDPIAHVWQHTYDYLHSRYPDIKYVDRDPTYENLGRTTLDVPDDPVIIYSDHGTVMPNAISDKLYTQMQDADYMINMAALKAHARAGMTLTAKNHFGSHTRTSAEHLHPSLPAPENDTPLESTIGYNKYRVFVDIMGHRLLGQNTLLYFIDGLWGGGEAVEPPVKFTSAPFNNDWSSSVIVSLDQIALESVCFDILRTEFNNPSDFTKYRPHLYGTDDYLRQGADRANWPDGILYDPENDGTILKSLGVNEHWNNAVKRQYSRNLGKEYGIELVTIPGNLAEDDPFVAHEASSPPVSDGQGDDDCWKSADWYNIDHTWIPWNGVVSPSDFKGRFKTLWSASENLMYFLVEIHDDVFIDGYQYPDDGYPNFDVVELFIDEDRSGGAHVFDNPSSGEDGENAFSYHLAVNAPADGEVTHDFVACDLAGKSWSDYHVANYAGNFQDFSMRKDGDTYTYEFALKVYNSDFDPDNPELSRVSLSEGKNMGVSLAYCDNDAPDGVRDNFFGSVWVTQADSNSHWENADDYGKLMLGPASGPLNHPPGVIAQLPDVNVSEYGTEITLLEDLSSYFMDEDGDMIDFQAFDTDPAVTLSVQDNVLSAVVEESFSGHSSVTVRASDPGSMVTYSHFSLNANNRSPVLVGSIPDYTLAALNESYMIVEDITSLFSDADNDALSFTTESDNSGVSASFNGNMLMIMGSDGFSGDATITVTASDGTAEASVSFMVSYEATGLDEISMRSSLVCFPNPVSDGYMNVRFSAPGNGDVLLKIFNMNGQMVMNIQTSKAAPEYNRKLDLSGLSRGFYLLELNYMGNKAVSRFTK